MSKFRQQYFHFLPLLTAAIFFYALVFLLIKFVYPESIANFLLPDLYLPLQISLAIGNFFFFTFLTQDKFWGLWITLLIFLYLFFRLQHFVFTLPLIVAYLFTGLSLFYYLLVLIKKQKK